MIGLRVKYFRTASSVIPCCRRSLVGVLVRKLASLLCLDETSSVASAACRFPNKLLLEVPNGELRPLSSNFLEDSALREPGSNKRKN